MRTHPSVVRHRVKVTDPPLTRRRGILTHPGSLILAAIAVLYTAFLFGFFPQDLPDRLFGSLSNHRQWVQRVSGNGLIFEIAIAVAGLFLLYTIVMPIIRHNRRRARRRSAR
jgi:hypothetical protein